MYLSHIFIENFRIFGSRDEDECLDLALKPGLNVLVGENDSGKSSLIDAIRIVLQTSSFDYYRLTEDDFHISPTIPTNSVPEDPSEREPPAHPIRASTFTIRCTFSGLKEAEIGRYLEWLSMDDDKEPTLHVTFRAQRREEALDGRRSNRYPYTVHAGKEGDGLRIEGDIREFLRVTYLKPLRDAEAELTAGRGSRLSQILESHPSFEGQKESDYDPEGVDEQVPETLLGIFRQAEARITKNPVISGTQALLNTRYLKELSLGVGQLRSGIGVSRETQLRQILEKLELWLEPENTHASARTKRGLGYNNILFIAAELLFLGDANADTFPMLLIEEPEAHLHPQMQLRLMEFLEQKSRENVAPSPASDQAEETGSENSLEGTEPAQILLTTHSPNLASKASLRSMVLLCRGRTYPLDDEHTRLDQSDYSFLERFLDVTKANLFFAKGVLMVEGDAENILIPVLAQLLGRPLSKYGISVVNVGHTGFFRFARILQTQSERKVPVPVACLADRDIVPDEANYVQQRKRKGEAIPTFESQFSADLIEAREASKRKADGDNVKTFISPAWTLEHDLALHGLAPELHAAIRAAKKAQSAQSSSESISTSAQLNQYQVEGRAKVSQWEEEGRDPSHIAAKVYRPLYKGSASKAVTSQMLAQLLTERYPQPSNLHTKLPAYILEALEHLTGPGLSPASHASPTHD